MCLIPTRLRTIKAPAKTTMDAPGIVWSDGSLNQTFTLAGIGEIEFNITTDGVFESGAAFGGQTPGESTANTGGLGGSQDALNLFLDFANRQQTATTVITLPTAIAGAQFTLFDVDFGTNDFADLVTVTGTYQGASVIPELTNGTANYVVGNTAICDAASGGTSGAANVVVTFDQPIDTITIIYGNAQTAPVVPDGQAVAIHDFDFCTPQTQLSVTKVSSIISSAPSSPPGTDKAIPGALVEYLIQVSNNGISDAGGVVVRDIHSGDIKLCRVDEPTGPVVYAEPGSPTDLEYVAPRDLEYLDPSGNPYTDPIVADSDGCDANIGGFRITPDGAMNGGTAFTLRIRYRIISDGLTP